MEHVLYIIKEMLFRVFVMFIIVEYYKIKAHHNSGEYEIRTGRREQC